MNEPISTFVQDLCALSPVLELARAKVVTYWEPEEPPITTLFGALGHAIIDCFSPMDDPTKHAIFTLLERGAQSSDDLLATAILTGAVEAMVSRAERVGLAWQSVGGYLGRVCASHSVSWIDP